MIVLTANEALGTLAILHDGDWDKIYKDIFERRELTYDVVKSTLEKVPPEITMISIVDKNYPEELRNQKKSPIAIFEVEDAEGASQYIKYSEAIKKVEELKKNKEK